jgi:CheY-like chemotaxis protein
MIKIFIVEDQTMLRESLEHVIGEQSDMEIAGSTDDAANAPEQCRRLQPDLVLMDVVTKNNSSGITAYRKIRLRDADFFVDGLDVDLAEIEKPDDVWDGYFVTDDIDTARTAEFVDEPYAWSEDWGEGYVQGLMRLTRFWS